MLQRTIRIALLTSVIASTVSLAWVPPSERRKARLEAKAAKQAAKETPPAAATSTTKRWTVTNDTPPTLALVPGAKIPSKWLKGAKGYKEALEIQKATGADIFVYFVRPNTSNEKGLCSWFENRGVKSGPVRKLLRGYVKVRVQLPANPRNQDLAKELGVGKTPAVYVMGANGWKNRCNVFLWDEKPLKLKEPDELVEEIISRSGERYQPGYVPPGNDASGQETKEETD